MYTYFKGLYKNNKALWIDYYKDQYNFLYYIIYIQ